MVQKISFKDFPNFSSGGHFALQNGTICAILVVGIKGNIHVKLLYIWPSGSGAVV